MQDLKAQLNRFLTGKRSGSGAACGIVLGENTLSLAYLSRSSTLPTLKHLISRTVNNIAETESALYDIVNQHALQGVPCYCVLLPTDYQLLLVDAPNVAPEELEQATRWAVKDLIDMPLRDVAIQVFPTAKQLAGKKMLNTVVTRVERLEQYAAMLRSAGLELSHINIAELALRDVVAKSADNNETVAVVYYFNGASVLTINTAGELSLIRHLDQNNLQAGEGAQQAVHAACAQEIKRSLDYYQHQLNQPPPTKILLAADPAEQALLQTLTELTALPAEPLNVEGMFQQAGAHEANSLDAASFLAVAGALYE